MRQSISDLCAILEEQKAVLKNMLELAKEERQIIVQGLSDKLEGIIRLEFKELSKLGGIEKRRLALIDSLAAEFNIPGKDITVTMIAEASQPEEKTAIRAIQKELTAIIEEHSAVNKENRSLIEAHVEYSKSMLELMVEAEDPLNNLYSGDGRALDDKKKTNLYDGHA